MVLCSNQNEWLDITDIQQWWMNKTVNWIRVQINTNRWLYNVGKITSYEWWMEPQDCPIVTKCKWRNCDSLHILLSLRCDFIYAPESPYLHCLHIHSVHLWMHLILAFIAIFIFQSVYLHICTSMETSAVVPTLRDSRTGKCPFIKSQQLQYV